MEVYGVDEDDAEVSPTRLEGMEIEVVPFGFRQPHRSPTRLEGMETLVGWMKQHRDCGSPTRLEGMETPRKPKQEGQDNRSPTRLEGMETNNPVTGGLIPTRLRPALRGWKQDINDRVGGCEIVSDPP